MYYGFTGHAWHVWRARGCRKFATCLATTRDFAGKECKISYDRNTGGAMALGPWPWSGPGTRVLSVSVSVPKFVCGSRVRVISDFRKVDENDSSTFVNLSGSVDQCSTRRFICDPFCVAPCSRIPKRQGVGGGRRGSLTRHGHHSRTQLDPRRLAGRGRRQQGGY